MRKRKEKERVGERGSGKMREKGGETLPSITSVRGKNEGRERGCEKEREGGGPSSFIQCQGLDSPPVIRLFHCAERSGWVGKRVEERGECLQDRETREEDQIHSPTTKMLF